MVVDNHMFGGTSSRVRGPSMDMERTEMSHDPLLLLEANFTKVLVTEDESTALSGVQGEFVEALVVQLGQLHAVDLGTNMGR